MCYCRRTCAMVVLLLIFSYNKSHRVTVWSLLPSVSLLILLWMKYHRSVVFLFLCVCSLDEFFQSIMDCRLFIVKFNKWVPFDVTATNYNKFTKQFDKRPHHRLVIPRSNECIRLIFTPSRTTLAAEWLMHSAAMCSRAWRAQWSRFDSARARPLTKEL